MLFLFKKNKFDIIPQTKQFVKPNKKNNYKNIFNKIKYHYRHINSNMI